MSSTGFSARIRRALRYAWYGDDREADLRRKLSAADTSIGRWKAKHEALATTMTRVAVEARRRSRDATARGDRLHRHVPEPDVLAMVLPIRAGLLPGRSSDPVAVQREHRFAAVSASYRDAMADARDYGSSIRTIDLMGLRWSVPLTQPDNPDYVTSYLKKQDFPFRTLTQTREVAIGNIMLDIGANVGRMSIPRVILGDVQAAYCAEPEPLNYACLVRNVRDNNLTGLVMPDRVAIGAADGRARLRRVRSAGGHRVLDGEGREDDVEIPVVSLDSWVRQLGLDLTQIAFVKVDVQGSEAHVLRGAASLLGCGHVAWQIEIDPKLLAGRGVQTSELLLMLQQHFTHFVDLHRLAAGARVRITQELPEALEYVASGTDVRTDVLLFNGHTG